ncbi:MAG: GNAT family protein [Clostridiales bacterium]|nr:GNAT family protein [Clostridiales bacterium]HBM80924.1 GNAT family N-acetyltransferase [Clostridiaceae bacterium]
MYYKKMIGQKCYLSPIDVDDYEKYTKWLSDMEVAAGMLLASKLITASKEKEILERLSVSEYNFAIIDLKTDRLLGNLGFPKMDYIDRNAEVGIFIGDKEYWGKGYGADALRLALDFGFNILNLHNIRLKVYSYNKQAISCYKKVGFKEAGQIREAKEIAGKRYDEIYMDMLDKEYESIYVKGIIDNKEL